MVDDRVVKWLLGILAGIILAGVSTIWQSTQKIDGLSDKLDEVAKDIDKHEGKEGHQGSIVRITTVEQRLTALEQGLALLNRNIEKMDDKLDYIRQEIQRNIGPQRPGGMVR